MRLVISGLRPFQTSSRNGVQTAFLGSSCSKVDALNQIDHCTPFLYSHFGGKVVGGVNFQLTVAARDAFVVSPGSWDGLLH